MPARECSRTACSEPAVSTLTYVYADATAVLGPLSATSEPHTYDLCGEHSARLTAPRGWRLIRVPGAEVRSDDLVALVDSVRRRPAPRDAAAPSAPERAARRRAVGETPERHLRVVRESRDD
ncbi:MAG: DUF3499 domain-containing protein [Brachybacterium sp.]|nr:DUF3499 domain-containing protein [Brachybacterium sp.]